ncbi:hypothetical protein BSBH6_03674 [Bacillus subtilis]|nr:hypothetical protein BSBH6_03674 [Bacillus subtilis]RPK22413.1 hypothetical protein BH5_03678 [Bacillus subtilis]
MRINSKKDIKTVSIQSQLGAFFIDKNLLNEYFKKGIACTDYIL